MHNNMIEVPSAPSSPIAPPSIKDFQPTLSGGILMFLILFLGTIPPILHELPPIIRVWKRQPKTPDKK
jgi:hypothetical protein